MREQVLPVKRLLDPPRMQGPLTPWHRVVHISTSSRSWLETRGRSPGLVPRLHGAPTEAVQT